MEGEACEILAEVTIEGFKTLPATGTYICVKTGVTPLTTWASPYVCGAVAVATPAAIYLNSDPALQEVSKIITAKGCQLVVDFGDRTVKLIVVNSKANIKKSHLEFNKAKRTFKALNTPQGAALLMQFMRYGR